MKQLRNSVPLLGVLALIVLFLKMPEAPSFFDIFKCKTCVNSDPYLPMIGGAYFAILIAISLLFPNFPGSYVARGGVIWALLLSVTFTYMSLPVWCTACLIAHVCNILIWIIWWRTPLADTDQYITYFKERIFLTLFAPICIVALFSSLNLTFLVYNLKSKQNVLSAGLQPGDVLPNFSISSETNRSFSNADIAASKRNYINFVSPNCPYCKEQLLVLKDITTDLSTDSYRLIHVSPVIIPELTDLFTASEWFEDKDGHMRELFKVTGYPTLFVVESDGKIVQVIAGVSQELKDLSKANK